MKEIISNGTQVLIFHRVRGHAYEKSDENKFIKGIVVSSEESDDLSYHGSPWYEQVYTILGEDGKKYTGTYGSAFIGNIFIRTIADHIKSVKFAIEDNNERIIGLNEENKTLNGTLYSLMQMEKENEIKTSTYVSSNDSEVIANLIDGFEYDPSKTDEILAKYKDLDKTTGPVKSLRPKNK